MACWTVKLYFYAFRMNFSAAKELVQNVLKDLKPCDRKKFVNWMQKDDIGSSSAATNGKAYFSFMIFHDTLHKTRLHHRQRVTFLWDSAVFLLCFCVWLFPCDWGCATLIEVSSKSWSDWKGASHVIAWFSFSLNFLSLPKHCLFTLWHLLMRIIGLLWDDWRASDHDLNETRLHSNFYILNLKKTTNHS